MNPPSFPPIYSREFRSDLLSPAHLKRKTHFRRIRLPVGLIIGVKDFPSPWEGSQKMLCKSVQGTLARRCWPTRQKAAISVTWPAKISTTVFPREKKRFAPPRGGSLLKDKKIPLYDVCSCAERLVYSSVWGENWDPAARPPAEVWKKSELLSPDWSPKRCTKKHSLSPFLVLARGGKKTEKTEEKKRCPETEVNVSHFRARV